MKGVLRCHMKIIVILLFVMFIFPSFLSGEPQVEKILQSTHSWDGGSFYYPPGTAEISILKVHLQEKEMTSFHCHLVPTAGYVLNGIVAVTLQSGKTKVFTSGQAIIEVTNVLHNGYAIGGDADILVFHAGASNTPNTHSEKSGICVGSSYRDNGAQ